MQWILHLRLCCYLARSVQGRTVQRIFWIEQLRLVLAWVIFNWWDEHMSTVPTVRALRYDLSESDSVVCSNAAMSFNFTSIQYSGGIMRRGTAPPRA